MANIEHYKCRLIEKSKEFYRKKGDENATAIADYLIFLESLYLRIKLEKIKLKTLIKRWKLLKIIKKAIKFYGRELARMMGESNET